MEVVDCRFGKAEGPGLLTDLGPAELKPIPVKTKRVSLFQPGLETVLKQRVPIPLMNLILADEGKNKCN